MSPLHTTVLLLALASPAAQGPADQDAAREQHEPNRLIDETSPYLLQHAYNPVDWYPWGPEAFAKARAEQKPVFLSVGYSACHWCHVMERESFEDLEIAAYLNEHFVAVKVDREERPDVDEIYMAAVQQLNQGRGGWPMSVFLTPDREPFFGGTYFPPRAARGRPGFLDLLRAVHGAWESDREALVEQGERMIEHLRRLERPLAEARDPAPGLLADALVSSERQFDAQHGGFGRGPDWAPKFPRPTQLAFLLRYGRRVSAPRALELAETTLRAMAAGGIHDQLGGGFHRYTVDRAWTVPHFEKMLYDNAQLAAAYLEAWQATGEPLYRSVAGDTLDWMLREMQGSEGGFYSSTDADSEGEEGRYFVWTPEELRAVLGDDAALAASWYGVTPAGNFEGRSVLTARRPLAEVAAEHGLAVDEARARLERCRAALLAARAERVAPGLDDKVVTAWNGLALSAFARAGMVWGEERWLAAARRNATFLLERMRREDGGLFRTRRAGRSRLRGTLEDHAFVVAGLLDLWEADLDPRWLAAARELHGVVEERFADPETGGYWSVGELHDPLPVRTASAAEGPLPSDVGTAATNAARLGFTTGETALLDRAWAALRRHAADVERAPTAHAQLLILLDLWRAEPDELYVIAPPGDPAALAWIRRAQLRWPPYRTLVLAPPERAGSLADLVPALEGKGLVDGRPTAYVCHGGVCERPLVLDAAEPAPAPSGGAGDPGGTGR